MDYRQNIYRILIVLAILVVIILLFFGWINNGNTPIYLKNCKECDGDIRGCAKQNITT